jgi:AcrR family transcriptional regulator
MGRKTPLDRDAQKQETRQALLVAGLAELSEHGLEAPSLDQICARAGFTRGAFYVHFKDRDDFLVAVMDHVLGQFLDVLTSVSSLDHGGVAQAVRFFCMAADSRNAAVHGGKAIRFHHLMEACQRSKVVGQRYRAMVKKAQHLLADGLSRDVAKKALRKDVTPAQVTTLMTAMALGVTAMIELDLPVNAVEVGETTLALLAP